MSGDHGQSTTQGAKPVGELRRFGWVMASAFAVLVALLVWRQRPAWPYFAALAAAFALAALVAPAVLRPIERAWMTLAGWLSVLMTYVVLTVAYFVVVTPLGLLRRVGGRDPLRMRRDPKATTYWVPVAPDGPGSRPDRPY